jgi:subtilisin-like proprotein convertase family protein/subtilisin family serine protease
MASVKCTGFLLSFWFAVSASAANPLGYGPAPNDAYWTNLWHLENLDVHAARLGIDINARGAWSVSRGAGVNIAIVDDGVELAHPDLANRAAAELHWNFETDTPFGGHASDSHQHGTAMAGMATAEGDNHRGIIGMAPEARFASWNIFQSNAPSGSPYVNSAQRAKMFTFHNQQVQVQSHSWVTPGQNLISMSALENDAISNAVTLGRGGKGVVIVRAGGNNRIVQPRNVNDDAYTSDPRVITVGAIRSDGRVASYGTPGAAILVSAPSGDASFPSPFSTDRLGTKGFNRINFATDHAEYVFGNLWQGGTSSATPLIAGVAALLLSVNPELTYRDVQQILIHAANQTDPADPGIVENGAGFRVSHNTGFGLLDAAAAVDLARAWTNRPGLATASFSVTNAQAIPDAGLRVLVTGSAGVPPGLEPIIALPSLGLVPDQPTAILPLVYIGLATGAVLTNDLEGKGALIQRGGGPFSEKLDHAQRRGAAFAVMYNNQQSNRLEVMGNTDFVGIPAVFISQHHGEALASLATNETVQAQLALSTANININVDRALLCEHVSVELVWEHQQRGDARVTLVSPMGTRSVLQRLGDTVAPFSGSWTFSSTHHFYESSLGTWTLEVSDQVQGGTGVVHQATLHLRGTEIVDSDADGLDDDWEQRHLPSLERGPREDPDADGYSNAREQILGTNPAVNETVLTVSLSAWNPSFVRMNWPSRPGVQYEVLGFGDLAEAPETFATVNGGFPRSAWFGEVDSSYRFFQVREKP